MKGWSSNWFLCSTEKKHNEYKRTLSLFQREDSGKDWFFKVISHRLTKKKKIFVLKRFVQASTNSASANLLSLPDHGVYILKRFKLIPAWSDYYF